MVFVTGDCHARWNKLSRQNIPEQEDGTSYKLTREDYVIVCGDFGIWSDDADERYRLDKLSKEPFTVLFVDGNHENFDRLYSDEFKVVDFHGGKAHRISSNVFHLMRGYVFDLCGKKFFTFGGASSHDISDGILDETDFPSYEQFLSTCRTWYYLGKSYRINHISWWKEEIPTKEEFDRGLSTIYDNRCSVDYVISHCAPDHIASALAYDYKPDALTEYFEDISNHLKFKHWYFGHYHDDRKIDDQYTVLYRNFERVV